MDIARPSEKNFHPVRGLAWAVPLVALLVALWFALFSTAPESSIPLQWQRIATVKRGEFDIVVRAPGTLVPKQWRWLSSEVGGRVERLAVLPGMKVTPGEVIIELSNLQLHTQQEERAWDVEASRARQQAELMSLQSQLLDQELAELTAKNQFESSQMLYKAHLKLRQQGLASISDIEFETTRIDTAQKKQHWRIQKRRTENLTKNFQAQRAVRQAELNKLEKQMKRAQEQVAALSVRATMAAVVQEVAVELGENVQPGGILAKLVREHELIARIQVPQIQAHYLAVGQVVTVDTRKSQGAGKIIRISPSVIDSAVEVDVELAGDLPEEARPDLSIDAEIQVASFADTIYVERPSYSQNDQTMQIFKLSQDESTAKKMPVQFGRGSASLIEVRTGLVPGDKIIVSDQSAFEKYNVVKLLK